jgi:uncharacterized protein (TIGR02246 family)
MIRMTRPDDIARMFEAAWNAHDMQALGDLFYDDATFVNRFGRLARGVDAIVALHAPIHETIYRGSTLENEVADTTPIGDDVAIVHFWSRLKVTAAHPAGPHAVDTLALAVLARRDGGWRVQAFENVSLTDPRTGEPCLRK